MSNKFEYYRSTDLPAFMITYTDFYTILRSRLFMEVGSLHVLPLKEKTEASEEGR